MSSSIDQQTQNPVLFEEEKPDKLYYSISEVADMFGVSQSLIRYWEKEFSILTPKKNKRGARYFTQTDIDHIKVIYHLVKERGFTLAGAQKKLKENKEGTVNETRVIESLQRLRQFLKELRDNLD